MGEYRLADMFQNLTVDTRKYFQMSEKQRERAPKQIFSAKFEDKKGKSILDEMEMSGTEAGSIADENPLYVKSLFLSMLLKRCGLMVKSLRPKIVTCVFPLAALMGLLGW